MRPSEMHANQLLGSAIARTC